MNLRSAARLSGLLLVLGAFGCADDGYKPTDLSNQFVVTPAFVGIDEGFPPIQFTATQGPDPVTVTWESSNPVVATVSPTGLVSPINDGFAAITATQSNGSKKSASMTVNNLLGTPLVSGVGVAGIGGAVGITTLLYRIYVPTGRTNLTVTLGGGTGDLDLYVQRGPNPPTTAAFGCRSWNGGNTERCSFTNPTTGTWYIFIDVYTAGAGATLTATVTP